MRIINRHNRIEFLVSEDGRAWKRLAADFDTSGYVQNALGGFEALRPALAATGEGTAHFTGFEYQSLTAGSAGTATAAK